MGPVVERWEVVEEVGETLDREAAQLGEVPVGEGRDETPAAARFVGEADDRFVDELGWGGLAAPRSVELARRLAELRGGQAGTPRDAR